MFKYIILVPATALILCGCDTGGGSGAGAVPSNSGDFNDGYTQIERLARPAINEALIITNDFLNAFNAIPPSADLSDAAAPVRAEAIVVLDVVTGLAPGGPTSAQVAGQFLPDVMRIDTAAANAGVGDSTIAANVGYTSCVNGTASGPFLCGGRKLQDDVVDITLTYIASGLPAAGTQPYSIGDGVAYATNHSVLPTAFPYLAPPK